MCLSDCSSAASHRLSSGGWAEELLQLVPPRPHRDVDLLLPADSFVAFDRFLASAECYGWREIVAKRFAHKRAFLAQGVMVEFTLVGSGLITNFWGDVAFHWLDPLAHSRPIEIDGFTAPLVSAANLLRYRQLHRTTEPWRWREQPTVSAKECYLISKTSRSTQSLGSPHPDLSRACLGRYR